MMDAELKAGIIVPHQYSSSTKAKKRAKTPSTCRGSAMHNVKTRHVPEKGALSSLAAAEMKWAGEVMFFL
jgi:hypothetical protein